MLDFSGRCVIMIAVIGIITVLETRFPMRRGSKQYNTVAAAVKSVRTHPNATDIYEIARKEMPKISLGTVYRNLKLLKADGEIIGFEAPDGTEHFDGVTDGHMHFVCLACGKIFDLETPTAQAKECVLTPLAEKGFDVVCADILLKGYCDKCSKKRP